MLETPSTPPASAGPSRDTGAPFAVSVVIPIYNEADGVDILLARLLPVLATIASDHEVIFVDDGSTDGTFARLIARGVENPRIRALSFSRNFGKEVAIAAGLDHAQGDAVVIMDGDLQHPPETLVDFVAGWREGFDVVYGQRMTRDTDPALRRVLTEAFYRTFSRIGETNLPPGAGDFRLMDRKVVLALRGLGERARFTKGLYAWVGFKTVAVPFIMAERAFGTSKWPIGKLLGFAFDGITSFSTTPLRISTYAGLIVSAFAILYATFIALRTLFFGTDLPGFASLIVSVMFFSGVQLLSLGLIGEYVGRIFAEVKRRPLYLIDSRVNLADTGPIRDERAAARTPSPDSIAG